MSLGELAMTSGTGNLPAGKSPPVLGTGRKTVRILAVAGFATSVLPWDDLTEGDRLYAVATRFACSFNWA